MSVSIPSSFDFGIDLNSDLDISGLPTSYTISTSVAPLTMALNLAPIEIRPVEFSLRLKEIPSVRAHLPLDYRIGLNVLGRELFCIHLCGQGQIITEPYVANPCELRPSLTQSQQPGLAELDQMVRRDG